jgi:hypothetical protein
VLMVLEGSDWGHLAPYFWVCHVSWWQEFVAVADNSQWMGSRKEGAPSDLLPPARPHFLKFLYPPETSPPAGNQSFNTFKL